MISIAREKVPAYLVRSSFYESLCSADTEGFCVPQACFKSTESVSGVEDLAHLLRTLQYWGVNDVPSELTSYLVSNHNAAECEQIYNLLVDFDSHTKFSEWYKAVQTIRMVEADSTDEDTIRKIKRDLLVLIGNLSSQNDVVSENAAKALRDAVRSRKCSRHTLLCYLRGATAGLVRTTMHQPFAT